MSAIALITQWTVTLDASTQGFLILSLASAAVALCLKESQ